MDLRAGRVRDAIVYLGKLDGYLAEVAPRKVTLTDVKGREYV